jgi:3-hydroxyisobutyrate dehydrogenase
MCPSDDHHNRVSIMAAKTTVAVLGLGTMGTGMATRLLGHRFDVTVYNRSPAAAEAMVQLGAKVAYTPREAAGGASVVLSMVADDDAARGVWLGPDGALAGVKAGSVLIESSTISVDWVRELSSAARDLGCELLDAPVSGSKPQAAAGELVFLVGGDETALEKARPLLAAMGRDVVHLGPSGSGALMKLINNFVSGVQVVALAEGINMIERSGLSREKAVAVLTNGAPGSPMVKVTAARMLASNFEPNFMLKLMTKDLRYAQAQSGGMDVCAAAIRTFERAIDAGFGDKDFSAVVECLRKR